MRMFRFFLRSVLIAIFILFISMSMTVTVARFKGVEIPPGKLFAVNEWHWPEESYECIPYVVKTTDTSIWDIAARLYPNRHTGQMVWAICRASNRTGPDGPIILPGQVLWVPDPEIYGKPSFLFAFR